MEPASVRPTTPHRHQDRIIERSRQCQPVTVPETVRMDDGRALDTAEQALRAERVIVLPTDTVYGLAALPSSARAVDDLYSLKDRPASMPIAMLVASREQVSML